jgi:hypothetical protein
MTTWILIVTIITGNASTEYAVANLPSYKECDRVSAEIAKIDYYGSKRKFLCIEVTK